METKKKGILFEISSRRLKLFTVIITAIMIALGVNLTASTLGPLLGLAQLWILIIGLAVFVGSTIPLVVLFIGPKKKFKTFNGFFIYYKKEDKIISIPRYRFSWVLREYLEAAFYENKALKVLWEKEPPYDNIDLDPQNEDFPFKINQGIRLIREAIEYFVLTEISKHINGYFSTEFAEKNLKEFKREDVAGLLFQNRFLKLFSEHVDNRPPFVGREIKLTDLSQLKDFLKPGELMQLKITDEGVVGELFESHASDGALYQHFELILPKTSTINRTEDNQFEIKTKGFSINVTVEFNGSQLKPSWLSDFLRHYMFLKRDKKNLYIFRFEVKLQAHFKIGSLLTGRGVKYYRWIDSFLEELDCDISYDRLLKTINWNTASTIIRCLKGPPYLRPDSKSEDGMEWVGDGPCWTIPPEKTDKD